MIIILFLAYTFIPFINATGHELNFNQPLPRNQGIHTSLGKYTDYLNLPKEEFKNFIEELFTKAKDSRKQESLMSLSHFHLSEYNYYGQFRYSYPFFSKVPSGYGILCYPQSMNILYRGEFLKGTFYGHGILYDQDGHMIYDGEFMMNKKNGRGIEYYQNGQMKYIGEFRDDQYHGMGTLYTQDGKMSYQAEFVHNQMKGSGTIFNENEHIIFKGLIIDDHTLGGTFYDSNGNIEFVGRKINNKADGRGILYSPNGNPLYKGEFKEGKYHSHGRLFYPNGRVQIEGEFKNGMLNGKCTEYYENERIKFKGECKNNVYDGHGILYDENGKMRFQGTFDNGLEYYGTAYDEHGQETLFQSENSLEFEKNQILSELKEQDQYVTKIIQRGNIVDFKKLKEFYLIVSDKLKAWNHPELPESQEKVKEYSEMLVSYGLNGEAQKTLKEFKELLTSKCMICLESIETDIHSLPNCRHSFHGSCILEYVYIF